MGLPATRKIGFPCLYGKGKVKEAPAECKGRIEKAHPILPKNEAKKKARLAPAMLEAMARPPKAATNAKAAPAASNKAAPAAKAPAAKAGAGASRKVAPPKLHNMASVTRPLLSPTTPPASVWGQKGAAPVLASAHLPAADPPEAADPSGGPRSAQVTVGLVLEEAMSKGLTKAQKKNLARKKKREAAGQEGGSEASSDHQETTAALLLEGDGAGSPSSGAAAAAAAFELRGFDGAAAVVTTAQDDILAQQGHKFITDPAQYAALLGLFPDSEEEEEYEEHEENEGAEYEAATEADGVPTPLPIAAPVVAPVAAPVVAPVAAPVAAPGPAQAPPAGKEALSEEEFNAAYNQAMADSIRSAQVEEEMRRQREVLASGGFAASLSKPAPTGFSPYPGVLDLPAAPVVAPVAAPVVAPVAAPSVFYDQTKQQPEAPGATLGGGWVFGGGNQGAAVPPHIPAGYAQYVAPYGEASVVGSMAAGHTAPEVAADDDDDDLSTLLALCGVAG